MAGSCRRGGHTVIMEHKRTPKKEYSVLKLVLTVIPLCALVAVYGMWALKGEHVSVAGLIASALMTLLFALLGVRFMPLWIDAWAGKPVYTVPPLGKRSMRRENIHPVLKLLGMLALTRVLLFIIAYAFVTARDGYTGGIFERLDIWNPGSFDARHYLSIAENGYQTEGDARLLLVFFPFYPVLVRLLGGLTGDLLVSGLIVSNLCFVLAGYVLYELIMPDYGRETALRTVKFLCLTPATVLFSAPMSDSLFLLISLLTVYLARRKRYVCASVVGFFAALTRLPGVLLVIPLLFECISDWSAVLYAGVTEDAKGILKRVGQILSVLIIPLGFGVYLFINRNLTGDWFRFLEYQQSNWHQGMGWFFSTAEYQTRYAIGALTEDLTDLLGLWLPNLLAVFGSLALVTATVKKLRPGYTAYFIAYFLVTVGATWLLSAPRYMAAAFPALLALALVADRKWKDALLTVLFAICSLGYLAAFLLHWPVY